jgi:hypothetical protein
MAHHRFIGLHFRLNLYFSAYSVAGVNAGSGSHLRAFYMVRIFSMFVLLQGRTKEEAFVIGQQIADAVTRDNPKPVKLKLEKVVL